MVQIVKETELGPLPENRPAGQPIEVSYIYDENDMMRCTFLDVNSKVKKEVEIQVASTAKEVESSSSELSAFILE